MASFTPGPWEVTYFTRPDGSLIETVEHVAETLGHSARECEGIELHGVTLSAERGNLVICYSGNGPTSEANARLIAAAPALFRALEAVERLLDLPEPVRGEVGAALKQAQGEA